MAGRRPDPPHAMVLMTVDAVGAPVLEPAAAERLAALQRERGALVVAVLAVGGRDALATATSLAGVPFRASGYAKLALWTVENGAHDAPAVVWCAATSVADSLLTRAVVRCANVVVVPCNNAPTSRDAITVLSVHADPAAHARALVMGWHPSGSAPRWWDDIASQPAVKAAFPVRKGDCTMARRARLGFASVYTPVMRLAGTSPHTVRVWVWRARRRGRRQAA